MTDRSHLSRLLHGAAGRGELEAYFQPQIDLESGEIVAVEALARWTNPELGLIYPAEFIPIAEENGDIHDVGLFMMRQACEFAADHCKSDRPLDVSLNVSTMQLTNSDFADALLAALKALDFAPECLTLEITESEPITDIPAVANRLTELRTIGFGVSIDDFGTGNSSLEQLANLPVTELKIDRSLIQDDSASVFEMLFDLVSSVRSRGIRVVAEGIETPDQLTRARELHCDRAQGYLIGLPSTRAFIEVLLNRS